MGRYIFICGEGAGQRYEVCHQVVISSLVMDNSGTDVGETIVKEFYAML